MAVLLDPSETSPSSEAGEVGLRQRIAADPRDHQALNRLGVLYGETGALDASEALLRRAVALQCESVAYLCDLVETLRKRHYFDEAIRVARTALQLAPDQPRPVLALGTLLGEADRPAEAVPLLQRAARLDPGQPAAWFNLGKALHETGDFAAAAAALARTLDLNPDQPEAWMGLGWTLTELNRFEAAIEAYDWGLGLDPQHARLVHARGVTLMRMQRLEEAWQAFDRGSRLDPKDPAMVVNRGLIRIAQGRFRDGWVDYERRFEIIPQGPVVTMPGVPVWRGEPLAGRRLLIAAEQGHGDTLQFLRYLPLVIARAEAGRIILAVQPGLRRFAERLAGVERVLVSGEPVPPVDLQIGLLSLPYLFDTAIETIPPLLPEIAPDPAAAARWSGLRRTGSLMVGLVWAGDPRPHSRSANSIDRRRSMRLADLAPLGALQGVTFINLQIGTPAEQLADPPPGLTVLNLMAGMSDFLDTAALTINLDLVISVDTAMAHLAASLRVPTWMVSRYDACWRWIEGRADSPWYPTLRVFRQHRPGEWQGVVAEVVRELGAVLAGDRRRLLP